MEKINELKVKLSGTVTIPREILTNATIDLKINRADCLDYRVINNHDGSFYKVYNVKISEISEVEFISDREKIEGNKKKSASQRLRGRAYIWTAENDDTDPEMFYQMIVNKIINNFDILVDYLRDK
ncbi:MAG: hypothetical protein A2499_03670 [Stygiobacter sp. RIFOXYC12_FULL_38_8]|jgi:hypothetical protein|nr:hypothetical protein [Bacteroidota bacterium]MBX2975946.1 hypothetical protein [Ignavibacteriaceae bacterium]OGV06821.1 MAG: hypothetical protein A2299_02830 [Stygiobacter sp. RIFOXYB2_FULL_37_11]OGV10486.1 MAG: hypothetical protein A2237_01120 [Stygiobacter sp. RIFOXYA2_FULL_38_8]OGV13280.1 MAG: hypothetical protein A2440_13210 [Stygiobacter sp. RIFOXYC2_FULL_38_25]OGV30233.1 MAG: hypothetical protein A2499_03670 [Stygiobacter sp. RIFOXYC12_FULL_38_8]OGV83326.1 MAG: hypothetical protein A